MAGCGFLRSSGFVDASVVRGFEEDWGLLMRVLNAGRWVLSGVGSVDSSFVRSHVGFKRFGIY